MAQSWKLAMNAGVIETFRYIAVCSLTLGSLASCASRPETGFLKPVAGPALNASDHAILVATTRERDARPGTFFNGNRSGNLDYATVAVSVPPKHQDGQVELPSSPPGNPRTDFVVRQAAYINGEKAFVRTLNARLDAQPRGKRKVLLFIHGYNTMFAEGLYRFAQIVHDAKSPAVPVLFTWASQGSLTGYVYDNNSATIARDDLEHTLRLIAASDADEVNIVAHSMGNWVTVEAIRQMKISGNIREANKIGAVILAAPDIDLDVFKSQMKQIGRPRKPFFVVVSKDDKALRFSKLIAGGKARLGADNNVEELGALGAIVIDLTTLKGVDSMNHGKFAQLASVAPELGDVLQKGIAANTSSAPESKTAIGGTLATFVTLPVRLITAPGRIASGVQP